MSRDRRSESRAFRTAHFRPLYFPPDIKVRSPTSREKPAHKKGRLEGGLFPDGF